MLNLLTTQNKKRRNPRVDPTYNKKFITAWLNLEILLQEDKLNATRSLVDNYQN